MAKSLAEQLLKAGLVDEKKAKAVKKEKYVEQKHARKHKVETVDEAKAAAETSRQQKLERDRELNRQMKEEAERKAVTAQIRQIIETNKVPRKGDVAYNFGHDGKVKTIYIDTRLKQQLVLGNLSIAVIDGRYELIPTGAAAKIRERDESYVALYNVVEKTAAAQEEEDPYAAFQIPDDLMW